MGKTNQAFNTSSESYGIELCSDTSTNGGGTIDFTYPYVSEENYYAGRIFFENNYGYFGFNANYIPSFSEILKTPQMTLSQDAILNVSGSVVSPNVSSTSTIYGNNLNTNFLSLGNSNKGSIYVNDYNTNYSSLRLANSNIIELCISDPLITTTSNILMYLDNTNGADFHCSLTSENDLSVFGLSNLQGIVSCSSSLNVSGSSSLNNTTIRGIITGNSSLNISGSTVLRSTLNVSGSATLATLVVANSSNLRASTTINSLLHVSGATLLRSDLTVSGTSNFNNVNINGTLSGITFTKSLVGLDNVANTAPSDLPISTATQSALTNKQNKTTYALPGNTNGTANYFLLGTLTTGNATGNVSTLLIESQYTCEGNPSDEYMAYVRFSTSNGFNYTMLGEDNTPFYGAASIICSKNFSANIMIQQNLPTSWSFYYYSGVFSGNGIFTINTNDTFTYSGTVGYPTGCFIYPQVRYTHSIGEINVDNINISNITGNGTLNISGNSVFKSNLFVSGTSNLNNVILNNASTVVSSFLISGATTLNSTLNVSGTATLNNLTVNGTTNLNNNLNFITAKTVFLTGGGLNINASDTLNLNAVNGVNLWGNNNTLAYFNTNGITLATNTKLLQGTTGDNNIIIQNTLTGTSSLGLFTDTNKGSRITQNNNGNLTFSINVSGTSYIPFSFYSNGVCLVGSDVVNNKMLVLNEKGVSDSPLTATNFYGFGINAGTLRYQAPVATNSHKFFCGSTQSFTITNGTGANGSDIRYKSEIQDITNALDKVKQLKGKTFIYNGCVGRQMGMIAQDVKPIVPEVVMIDDDGYHLMCYDRLVALLIESIKELEQRVQTLENKV
jgi:hypothetical protein